ncbi:MAG: hypothetical protein H7Z37_09530 [Pyrinomonadaceae bacterium]|nr:hypothetical protein [Pyrinomonadaceae bacterium]
MTTNEILSEISKLPLTEKREVLEKLNEQINGEKSLRERETDFERELLKKGLIGSIPTRFPDDEFRKNFKPIEINGEPISETIIKERR